MTKDMARLLTTIFPGVFQIGTSTSWTSERNLALASWSRCRYQASAASTSCHACGWKRHGLFACIWQQGRQAAYLFVRNHLNFARVDVLDTALDLFGPGRFNALVGWLLVEAFKKGIC